MNVRSYVCMCVCVCVFVCVCVGGDLFGCSNILCRTLIDPIGHC